MDELEEITEEFLVESRENLDELDVDLIALEQDPSSRERLSSIFRTIHTIKGTSGFLAFSKLEEVAHAGENLLSRLRDGLLELTPARTDALLTMTDCVRGLLEAIESTGTDGARDVSAQVAAINAAMEEQTQPAPAPALMGAAVTASPSAHGSPATPAPEDFAVAEPQPAMAGGPAAPEVVVPAQQAAPIVPSPREGQTPSPAQPAAVVEPVAAPVEPAGEAASPQRRSSGDSTIRVDVGLLDDLMLLVGELVLTRNQIVQYASHQAETELAHASQRLNLIASELQEGVMKTRMQPIEHVWSKFPRVVRDLGIQCGKSVRLEMDGGETELDKTLLEAIKDPLTHLVRNSVDHGIETPAERLDRGKDAVGTLSLRASHEGGQVVVEIADDGKGIDPAVIGAKALERGLVSSDQLTRMSRREMLELIFAPGFSTAAAVTNVSGRGVGMDVVRTNVEKIGGTVDLSSQPGAGTTIRVKIPLTLAIIPALVVGLGGVRYAIPQASLLELVRFEGAAARTAVEHVAGAPVLRLRGKLLPLVSLSDVLDRASTGEPEEINVVVLQADDVPLGLVVDEVRDTQEIVVKPLGRALSGVPIYAGATIMGDGKVALILDVMGLAHEAEVLHPGSRAVALLPAERSSEETVALLVVAAGPARCALPLAGISRLEEVPAAQVELAGCREVVQYRDGLLPLVHLSTALGIPATGTGRTTTPGEPELLPVVVVPTPDGGPVGLVVDEIVDICQEHLVLGSVGRRPGLRGSAVVGGRVTDLLDVEGLLAGIAPHPQVKETADDR